MGVDGRGVSVHVLADVSGTVVEMTLRGRWSQQLGDQFAALLRDCLAGPVEAIIVDLHEVGDLHGVSLPSWLAAQRTARLGPLPVHLAFCPPPRSMLDYRLRHQPAVAPSLFATRSEARIATGRRLRRGHRVQTRLTPGPDSVRVARELVAEACRMWRLPELRHSAALIASELATNVVDHAGTAFVVTVLRRAHSLHVVVQDCDASYPRVSQPVPDADPSSPPARGWGLKLVDTIADRWGVMPSHRGKVVWATLSA
ncbi:hypothetical protein GCM10025331_19230 [Actinoplanes utahensis]|nr:hypothetical protein Aut01nite_26440 [Actinoplanes utahensis]